MPTLSRADLWSLEEYAERRPTFRQEVMAHKKSRQLALGEHARLYFEDALTIKYQIQEMLRIEKVFEAAGINEELEAYNPLIPDGHNWKATFMVEYADPAERAEVVNGVPFNSKHFLSSAFNNRTMGGGKNREYLANTGSTEWQQACVTAVQKLEDGSNGLGIAFDRNSRRAHSKRLGPALIHSGHIHSSAGIPMATTSSSMGRPSRQ